MRAGGSLPLPIIHIYQHSSKILKSSKFTQKMAKIISNGEKVDTKIRRGC